MSTHFSGQETVSTNKNFATLLTESSYLSHICTRMSHKHAHYFSNALQNESGIK